MPYYNLQITVSPNMTDEDIRSVLWRNKDNSAYATTVCRKCGIYKASPDGDSRICPITDDCSFCRRQL